MTQPVSHQFARFAVIGVGGLFVDMAALALALNLLGLDPYGGRVFSYLMAATFTWYMNRQYTFTGISRRGAIRQWARFLAANAVGALVNYGVYVLVLNTAPWVIRAVGLWPGLFTGLLPYIGVAAGSVSGLVFNFFLSKKLVFRKS
ncbi:MAG: GtrA family protein [Niveispirillum sp.]|uniref:GtrA family protein n=1 Tax=Niveispirillum sp. TaxID=1917217 RepID=UPI003BA67211